ncbi:MAG: type II toxin-antitoxin system RelE/ParE family toxin [Syntrophobacteraceae bacterium]
MKVKDVVVMKEVTDDLNDGKAFYEQKEAGIGEYFWDSVFADIEALIIYAGVHLREHGLYRMLSRRFPYAIYYEIVDEIAYVIAVLPMRRSPAWLKGKLQERS